MHIHAMSPVRSRERAPLAVGDQRVLAQHVGRLRVGRPTRIRSFHGGSYPSSRCGHPAVPRVARGASPEAEQPTVLLGPSEASDVGASCALSRSIDFREQRSRHVSVGRRVHAATPQGVGRQAHLRLSRATGSTVCSGAFHEFEDEIEFVQTRHEEIAAFAACAHAKLTGEVGVCMATSGPGAIHLLNGLYDAKLDHAPVVAIVGQQARMSLGSNFQQEVDLTSLFKDVASEFVQICMAPEQAAHLIDRAIRIAKATRSVTCVIVPNDVQEAEYSEPPHAHGAVPSSVGFLEPVIRPRDEDLQRAADVLNAGEKVAMLVGQGALGAEDQVVEVAELLGAGVAKALNGRAAVPDDLPFVTGPIGLLGSKPTYEMIEGCDTLLMVGSSFPYSEWLPEVREGSRGTDRHRRPRWWGSAIRWRSTSSVTAPRPCAR